MLMISHTTLGTNNLIKSERFYSQVIGAIGGTQIYQSETVVFWEFEGGGAKLALTVPFNGELATHGNGSMVAFNLPSIEQVNDVFSIAISLGASSEGEPGERSGGAYYAAYFRDLDGNKIAIFHR